MILTRPRLALLLGMSAWLGAATPVRADDPAAAPALAAVADAFDAGTVEAGTRITHTYELRNRGTKPLTLTVVASCGCTTTDFDKVIAPGGSGTVTAALETRELRGRLVKSIRVSTDDPTVPSLALTLTVDVVPILEIKPADHPVLRGPVGALEPLELTIRAPDDSPFEILRVEDDPQLRARVRADDPAPSPGTSTKASRGHRRYRVMLTPQPDLAIGSYSPRVTLVTTRLRAERLELQPMITVVGPLVVTPLQLHVRAMDTPASVRVTAAAKGTAFRVLRATSSNPDFTAAVVPVKAGRQAVDVMLTYTGSRERRGDVRGTLEITTDQPLQPKLLVTFNGRF